MYCKYQNSYRKYILKLQNTGTCTYLSGLWEPGVPRLLWHPQFDRSVNPISNRGSHYPHPVLCALSDFQTFRRPCILSGFLFRKYKTLIFGIQTSMSSKKEQVNKQRPIHFFSLFSFVIWALYRKPQTLKIDWPMADLKQP